MANSDVLCCELYLLFLKVSDSKNPKKPMKDLGADGKYGYIMISSITHSTTSSSNHTPSDTHTHTHLLTRTRTCTHTHAHTHMHTHTHTRTHKLSTHTLQTPLTHTWTHTDFLPLFVWVLVQCDFHQAEVEAEYMSGLAHPSLFNGEAGYYLTTLTIAGEQKQHADHIDVGVRSNCVVEVLYRLYTEQSVQG